MEIETFYTIQHLTTFGIDVKTAVFIEVTSIDDLNECRVQGYFNNNFLIIGGGSNLLFCGDYKGFIIQPAMKGISIIERTETSVIVEAKSGEVWDDLVAFTVENEFYGLENLSFIPGTVGACPIQNIGAYGIEVQSVIDRVEAFEIETGTIRYFSNEECHFAYRDSIFKQELQGKYIITSVRFKLSLVPVLHIDYKDVKNYLASQSDITLQGVRDAIVSIRKAKLPDPAVVGNAGSFFKNPVVSAEKAKSLLYEFPSMVMYPLTDGSQKLAAGWLIDKAGWKGFRRGDAGVHPLQALCLVNYGNATGNEIVALATEIQTSVKSMFGVEIVPEVKIV